MNPAGRDASVAPDSIAALSCSVVTDRSCWFAGMTGHKLLPAPARWPTVKVVTFVCG